MVTFEVEDDMAVVLKAAEILARALRAYAEDPTSVALYEKCFHTRNQFERALSWYELPDVYERPEVK